MRLFSVRIGMAVATAFASFVPLFASAPTFAATCIWSGSAGDHLFSNAANWTGTCTGAAGIPGAGDDLSFDTSIADTSPNNDIGSASFGSISFSGTGSGSYTISGSPMTLSGGISDTSTNGGNAVNVDITLAADQTFTGVGSSVGNFSGTNTLALGSHNLSLTDSGTSTFGSNLSSVITGTGNISISGGRWNLNTASPGWSGNVSVANQSSLNVVAGSLGTGAVTVTAGGSIQFCVASDSTFANAFTVGQTGSTPAMGFGSCGGPVPSSTTTLSGPISLTSNVSFGDNSGSTTETIHVTGPLSGAYTLTPVSGSAAVVNIESSNNTSSTPNSIADGAGNQTITYSDTQASTPVTIVNKQKVLVDGSRGDITVQSGGTLGGHGTVGTVSVASGGTLAPGNSPGCLASGNVTLVAGANYNVDIAGTTVCTQYDQQVVTGTVDVGGATLNINLTFVPTAGDKFEIINNDAADAITGTFAGLAEGATVTANGYDFTISYVGGNGNDVELTAVGPTPGAPALPAAAHSTSKLPIAFTLIALLSVIGIEIGRRASVRR